MPQDDCINVLADRIAEVVTYHVGGGGQPVAPVASVGDRCDVASRIEGQHQVCARHCIQRKGLVGRARRQFHGAVGIALHFIKASFYAGELVFEHL